MKVLILAAGFGTRLQRDIRESGTHKELESVPKPLLPVSGKPVISHWMEILGTCPETRGDVYVVVNDANFGQFQEWAVEYPAVRLVSSGCSTNETRPGAVACIHIPVKHFGIQDHLLVIGGDTLFYEDFILAHFLAEFRNSPAASAGGAFLPYYTCPDEDTVRRGILELDENGKVVSFLEKPKPTDTTSRKANPCLYLFSKDSLPLISQFLQEKKVHFTQSQHEEWIVFLQKQKGHREAPMKEKDATGNFVKYLYSRRPVYTFEISGRYDIGGLESYLHCCSNYRPPSNQSQTL